MGVGYIGLENLDTDFDEIEQERLVKEREGEKEFRETQKKIDVESDNTLTKLISRQSYMLRKVLLEEIEAKKRAKEREVIIR